MAIITAIFGIYIAYNLLSGSGVKLVTAILLGLVMGAVLSFLIWNLHRWINNMASHNKKAEPNGVKPDDSPVERRREMKHLLLTTIYQN